MSTSSSQYSPTIHNTTRKTSDDDSSDRPSTSFGITDDRSAGYDSTISRTNIATLSPPSADMNSSSRCTTECAISGKRAVMVWMASTSIWRYLPSLSDEAAASCVATSSFFSRSITSSTLRGPTSAIAMSSVLRWMASFGDDSARSTSMTSSRSTLVWRLRRLSMRSSTINLTLLSLSDASRPVYAAAAARTAVGACDIDVSVEAASYTSALLSDDSIWKIALTKRGFSDGSARHALRASSSTTSEKPSP
mmetsp:Transcript_8319/g.29539  ORF Transcript_8319/g.29539 Transcript_8319/m.29539 type:complete len:250 (+) Transcript_8319:1583-2332(+)